MGSERNFRSHYYEKMGFRGVEEKKSLDILLRDKPVDLARIHNFCLRFPLPGIYRGQVWQLLLGVMPVHTNNTEFVQRQRQEQYRESERALTITRRIDSHTTTNNRITLVWLLETNCLKFDTTSQLREQRCQDFSVIVRSLDQLVSSPEEIYWVAREVFSLLESFLQDPRPLYDCLGKLLSEESGLLVSHLESCGGVRCPQFHQLWTSAFAGVFQPSLLARLWDKLIAGSSKVLAYVLASALSRCRSEVMGANTQDEILSIITSMKEDRQEIVLTQALDLWEADGCPLQGGGGGQETCASHVTSSLDSRLSLEIIVD